MFKRFDRLMPILKMNKIQNILYNKYNFTPILPSLSIYGDAMSYLFKKNNIRYIHKKNLKIPYDEQWEIRDFNTKKKEREFKTLVKVPYKDQWEVRDFYVPNKNINKYIEKKKKDENRDYDLVVLNDKTITYNDYIQQLFLLDKKNSCK